MHGESNCPACGYQYNSHGLGGNCPSRRRGTIQMQKIKRSQGLPKVKREPITKLPDLTIGDFIVAVARSRG